MISDKSPAAARAVQMTGSVSTSSTSSISATGSDGATSSATASTNNAVDNGVQNKPRLQNLHVREFAPADFFLAHVPSEVQRKGTLFPLCITCLDAGSTVFVLGTNAGHAYVVARDAPVVKSVDLQVGDVTISCVRIKSSPTSSDDSGVTANPAVKFAAASVAGDVVIVHGVRLPYRSPPRCNATSPWASNTPQANGTDIEVETPIVFCRLHLCRISCLEWNWMGTKLFSGDVSGKVILTKGSGTEENRSIDVLQENSEIVQIHVYDPETCSPKSPSSFSTTAPRRLDLLLTSVLISTKHRTVVHRIDGNANNCTPVGQKARKTPGSHGACFNPAYGLDELDEDRNANAVPTDEDSPRTGAIWAARGSRLLQAQLADGNVFETIKFTLLDSAFCGSTPISLESASHVQRSNLHASRDTRPLLVNGIANAVVNDDSCPVTVAVANGLMGADEEKRNGLAVGAGNGSADFTFGPLMPCFGGRAIASWNHDTFVVVDLDAKKFLTHVKNLYPIVDVAMTRDEAFILLDLGVDEWFSVIRLSTYPDPSFWTIRRLDPDLLDLPPPLILPTFRNSSRFISTFVTKMEEAANPYANLMKLPRGRRRELQRIRRIQAAKRAVKGAVGEGVAMVASTTSKVVAGLRAAAQQSGALAASLAAAPKAGDETHPGSEEEKSLEASGSRPQVSSSSPSALFRFASSVGQRYRQARSGSLDTETSPRAPASFKVFNRSLSAADATRAAGKIYNKAQHLKTIVGAASNSVTHYLDGVEEAVPIFDADDANEIIPEESPMFPRTLVPTSSNEVCAESEAPLVGAMGGSAVDAETGESPVKQSPNDGELSFLAGVSPLIVQRPFSSGQSPLLQEHLPSSIGQTPSPMGQTPSPMAVSPSLAGHASSLMGQSPMTIGHSSTPSSMGQTSSSVGQSPSLTDRSSVNLLDNARVVEHKIPDSEPKCRERFEAIAKEKFEDVLFSSERKPLRPSSSTGNPMFRRHKIRMRANHGEDKNRSPSVNSIDSTGSMMSVDSFRSQPLPLANSTRSDFALPVPRFGCVGSSPKLAGNVPSPSSADDSPPRLAEIGEIDDDDTSGGDTGPSVAQPASAEKSAADPNPDGAFGVADLNRGASDLDSAIAVLHLGPEDMRGSRAPSSLCVEIDANSTFGVSPSVTPPEEGGTAKRDAAAAAAAEGKSATESGCEPSPLQSLLIGTKDRFCYGDGKSFRSDAQEQELISRLLRRSVMVDPVDATIDAAAGRVSKPVVEDSPTLSSFPRTGLPKEGNDSIVLSTQPVKSPREDVTSDREDSVAPQTDSSSSTVAPKSGEDKARFFLGELEDSLGMSDPIVIPDGENYDSSLDKKLSNCWSLYSLPDKQGEVVSLVLMDNFMFVVDEDDTIFCAESPDYFGNTDWKAMDGVTAYQLAISPDGNVAWRLRRDGVLLAITGRPANPVMHPFHGGRWREIRDDVKWITLDGDVGWCLTDNGQIYVYKNLTQMRPRNDYVQIRWEDFEIVQISARDHVVWCLTASGSFLIRVGVTKSAPQGLKWVEQAPPEGVEPVSVTVGDAGVVWMVDSCGTIRFRPGLTMSHPQGADVWYDVTINNYMLSHDPEDPLRSQSLLVDPGQNLASVNFNHDLNEFPTRKRSSLHAPVLAHSSIHGLWFCDNNTPSHVFVCKSKLSGHSWGQAALIDPWDLLPGPQTSDASTISNQSYTELPGPRTCESMARPRPVDCSSSSSSESQSSSRRQSDDASWTQLAVAPGAVPGSHLVWCLHRIRGDLFCWFIDPKPPASLLPTPPAPPRPLAVPDRDSFSCISATATALWGVTPRGAVWARLGMTPATPLGEEWRKLESEQLGNTIVYLAIGRKGVFAVDCYGSSWYRFGVTAPVDGALPAAWVRLDEKFDKQRSIKLLLPPCLLKDSKKRRRFYKPSTLLQIAVGGDNDEMVWAIDSRHGLHCRVGVTSDLPIGEGWERVMGSHISNVCISDDTVWALTPQGEILRRYGITEKNPSGDYWKRIPGDLAFLATSPANDLWGVSADRLLFRRRAHLLNNVRKRRGNGWAAQKAADLEREHSLRFEQSWEVL